MSATQQNSKSNKKIALLLALCLLNISLLNILGALSSGNSASANNEQPVDDGIVLDEESDETSQTDEELLLEQSSN